MLIELRQCRQSPNWKHDQTKVQALANRDNTTIDQVVEVLASCGLESWLRAREALNDWSSLNDSQKEELAEVVFCGFTFFGKRALEEAYAIEPEVLSHYKSFFCLPRSAADEHPLAVATGKAEVPKPVSPNDMIVLPQGSAPSLVGSTATLVATTTNRDPAAPPSDATSVAASAGLSELAPASGGHASDGGEMPQSLRQLYALIGRISHDAESDPGIGPEPAGRIKSLLDKHLQRLIAVHSKLPAAEVRRLIERYCSAVLQMTHTLEFGHSNQRDLVPALTAAWKAAVVRALEQGRPQAWFDLSLNERREMPEFVERYASEIQKIAKANAEIGLIRAQLADAKYTARTALKASEIRKQGEITSAQGELDTLRVEAAHRLLPEGRTLDDLMEDVTLQLDCHIDTDAFDAAAVKALQVVVHALDGMEELPSAPFAEEEGATAAVAPVAAPSEPEPALQPGTQPLAVPIATEPTPRPSPAASPAVEPVEPVVAEVPPHAQAAAAGLPAIVPATSVPSTVLAPELVSVGMAKDEATDSVQTPIGEIVGEASTVGTRDSLEASLRHLQPAESREEAQKAFRIGYDQFSQVPSSVVEAVALHWLHAGHLNVAHQILRDAKDTTLVTGRVFDAALLRSAFYGMHMWPKDRDALGHSQRDLNLINYKDLEEELERRPSGKLTPYLIICATLQPALFAGRETPAPSLLRMTADFFDGALNQLIVNICDFTMRGGRVDLDALRDEPGQEARLVATRLQDQVRTWVDLNAHRTTRWMPLRVALRVCVMKPLFVAAIQAIQDGEKGDVAAVRLFVSTYSVHSQTHQLLDELLDEIRADYVGPRDQADSPAYAIFQQQVDSLIAIAQAWLLEVAPSEMRQKEVSEFLKRFHTQLD